MPSESSFDIVSKIDRQEADNALNQAAKEISQRFDFKNVGASIAWSGENGVEIRANSEERASAVLDVFKEKLVKRGVSLKHLDPADPKVSGKEYRIAVALKEGITQENAKKVSKIIRDEGPKSIKAQIQGEELRVSSKSRDDLQSVMTLLKSQGLRLRPAVHQLPLREKAPPVPTAPQGGGPARWSAGGCSASRRAR